MKLKFFAYSCLVLSALFGVLSYRANENRWHEGPTLVIFSPGHGLHEMDAVLISAAIIFAVAGVIAALLAKR